jgi:hypothetical protein
MESINPSIFLSENEKTVRTYRCTKLRRFLAPPNIGYLTITNKRLIYHSVGKTIMGSNSILAEMPVEDAAGISTSIGKNFNWLLLIIFFAILFFGTKILTILLPQFLTGWVLSILLVIPYCIALLFEKEILNKDIKERAVQQLQNSSISGFIQKKDSSFFMGIFQTLFVVGLVFLSWNIGMRTDLVYNALLISYIVIFGSYLLIYFMLFGRQRGFFLQVSSKTAKGTGINISANLLNGGFLTGAPLPAEDAELVVYELGAILTDIQQMGEIGVQKWNK